jgi:hypothetical protein
MKTQQPDQTSPPPEQGVNFVEMFVSFAALPVELLLHNPFTFGVRSAGARGAGAVLLMYAFGMFYTVDNRMPLFVLMIATAILCVVAQVSAMVRQGRGECCHSRYNGRPYAMAFLPISELRMKRIEPSLVLGLGWVVHHWNHPLGSFVMTSAFCQGFRMVAEFIFTRTRALDLNDALAEQTVAMQSVRRTRRR